jgi:hypothetical protein
MGSNRQVRWVEVKLEQVLKDYAKTRIALEEGEQLVGQDAYVDVGRGFVAFKLDTYVTQKAAPSATKLSECPCCKRTPRLLTTYPRPDSESHRFECDKCELTTAEYPDIGQAAQAWNSVVMDGR